MKGFTLSVGLLAGTIIGAGIFSLPYVINQIGLIAGVFYLAFFAFVYFLIFLMYAALLQTSEEEHRFIFLARKFLPKHLAGFASLTAVLDLIFTLTVYLILAVSFLGLITDLPPLVALTAFWFFGSVFIFAKLSFQGAAEVLGTLAILAIVVLVFFSGSGLPDVPLFREINFDKLLLPFGPLLFAYAGRVAISRIIGEYRKEKSAGRPFSMKKAILAGTFLPTVVYLIFVFGVLRLAPDVSPEALSSLSFLPSSVLSLLGALGILAVWTSYFMIGADVRENLKYDLKIPKWVGSLVVLVFPLALYFAGFQEFLTVLSLTGGVFLGLEGIFIIAMWRRAFPSHRLRHFVFPLYLVFFLALIYSLGGFIL
ncbi:hypothetical protein A2127_02245 [Candidatus Jorgensenbacteria bacterium GWC1_48_12]|uniref:Amino acid transporter transmembrane domain-containing protein n=1 Tax=Candidatus Jorgensenbacteria bacterium GWC1_48_12 TaxID=1798469 RepID=A0A1F6BMJ7_9BACT|nr:MAG: hypothetical protein A2127_02245 [Candidatus Jorgensenbacteria bacterium GWC1_48_12]